MSMPDFSGGGILGKEVRGTRRSLDVFELERLVANVTYTSDEVTANCPVTGQPDWYTVEIIVTGSLYGIESKSLKLYLQSFKDEGIFCEAFAARIANDVFSAIYRPVVESYGLAAVEPPCVIVTVTQKPRGGISIKAEAFKS